MAKATKITPGRPAVTLNHLEHTPAEALAADGYHDYVAISEGSLEGRDLEHVTISESELSGLAVSEVDLSDARISDSRLCALTGTRVRGSEIAIRNTEITQSRLGVLDFGGADLRTVLFERCKLGFVELRNARAADVSFEDCVIEELDLTGAKISRLSLRGSSVKTLTLAMESAAGLDLRGAELTTLTGTRSLHGVIIDDDQLMQFAGQLVQQLGAQIM